MTEKVGFVVIYRWRLHPGKEEAFVRQWSKGTPEIIERCGGLGSRMHRAEDGTWLAYAQWPDRKTWEAAYQVPDWDPEGERLMREAVAESFPRILLQPKADFLIPATIQPT